MQIDELSFLIKIHVEYFTLKNKCNFMKKKKKKPNRTRLVYEFLLSSIKVLSYVCVAAAAAAQFN